MKTLVVDDDAVNRKMLQLLLKPYGECCLAANGREAVEMYEKAMNAGNPFHLICLDILMPEMDGYEALEKIRNMEAEKGIHGNDGVKVIMTTVLKESRNVVKAFRSQCEGYLIKPIEKTKLLAELEQLGLIPKGDCVLDEEAIKNLVESTGDALFISSMLLSFLQNTPQRMEELSKAVHQKNMEEVAGIAHKMTSITGTYGLKELSHLFLRTEELAREHQGEEIEVLFPKLRQAYSRAQKELQKFLNEKMV